MNMDFGGDVFSSRELAKFNGFGIRILNVERKFKKLIVLLEAPGIGQLVQSLRTTYNLTDYSQKKWMKPRKFSRKV